MAAIKQKITEISNKLRLTKEGENPFQKFSYFKPDDILKALTPLLAEYKLFMSFNLPYNRDKMMYEAVLYFEDLEDEKQNITYKFDIPLTKVAGASEAQGAGATMTYAKRYSIMNAFSIADNSDDLDSKSFSQEKPATGAVKGLKSEEKSGACPECGNIMIIKTGKKKDGKDWRGEQCPNLKCKHHKEFIFLPTFEEAARANNQDAINEEANQNHDDREYGA